MLRITKGATAQGAEIRLEGKLSGAWVDEAKHVWQAITAESPDTAVLVDLCGVSFIDAPGKQLLKQMFRQGAAFRCCGPDITATVEEVRRDSTD